MKYIGIHIGHDSSATLFRDGQIELSSEEERFTRKKNQRGFPHKSLNWIFNESNLEHRDIDAFVFSGIDILEEISVYDMKSRLTNFLILKYYYKILHKFFPVKWYSKKENKKLIEIYFLKYDVPGSKIFYYPHHLLHAASALFESPFKHPLIVTSDGKGDDLSATISQFNYDTKKFKFYSEIPSLSSVGQVYTAVTVYLGFKPNRHEGKITGLAAYGDPSVLENKFQRLFLWNEDEGRYESRFESELAKLSIEELALKYNIPKKFIKSIRYKKYIPDKNYDITFELLRQYLSTNLNGHSKEDIAAAVQLFLEKITCKYIEHWLIKTKAKCIVLAGGVFANVKLNQRIFNLRGVENIFIQPAMSDSGLSVGGCLYHAAQVTDLNCRIKTVQRGPSFSNKNVLKFLNDNNISFKKYDCIQKQAKIIAKKIDDGQLVGLFTGRMEFGPRALGSRSVLISPKDNAINITANKRFNRTEFMPFAPVVIDKYASEYFINYDKSHIAAKFMTITYDVFEEKSKSIEAVVHIDNTARPQIIEKDDNPLYYAILEEHYNITGIPITVNTSFNAHEEPIVCKIQDAYKTLQSGIIDTLVIEDFIVER